jgi:hypothetical protein
MSKKIIFMILLSLMTTSCSLRGNGLASSLIKPVNVDGVVFSAKAYNDKSASKALGIKDFDRYTSEILPVRITIDNQSNANLELLLDQQTVLIDHNTQAWQLLTEQQTVDEIKRLAREESSNDETIKQNIITGLGVASNVVVSAFTGGLGAIIFSAVKAALPTNQPTPENSPKTPILTEPPQLPSLTTESENNMSIEQGQIGYAFLFFPNVNANENYLSQQTVRLWIKTNEQKKMVNIPLIVGQDN